jgi:alpha-beta hydrolase superfamily lysophospholipase
MKKWLKTQRWLIATFAVAVVGLLVSAWLTADMLLAPANRTVGSPPQDFPAETTTLSSESGSQIATWHLRHDDSQATIVLLHGLRGNRRAMLKRARLFHESGYSVVLIDMQAHGESPGKHLTIGYLERHDVRAAVKFTRANHPNEKIGIVAVSMGGAAALLASPLDIDALVLESVYPTITEAVHDRIWAQVGPLSYVLAPLLLCQLPPRLGISTSDLRPIDHMKQVKCPLLIAGGMADLHTPPGETRRMYRAADEPKHLVLFDGAAHVDLLDQNPEKYKAEIVPFLTGHLLSETAD